MIENNNPDVNITNITNKHLNDSKHHVYLVFMGNDRSDE